MSNLIKIDLSRDKLTATIKVTGIDPITRDDILGALKDSGVVYGVFEDVVDIATSGNIDDFMVIARGDPPVVGKNGWVEILWNTKDPEYHPDAEKTVDFRETSNLISVNEGALLAQIHPPQEGMPGKSVTGEVISPPQPKNAMIMPGKGVRLDNSGDKVYAANQGRPVAKLVGPNAAISVEPTFTVTGDVCLKTGNIRFKGDVIVTGSVSETMKLEASGNVTINGIVTGAHVYSGKDMVIQRNIISCEVAAGIGAMESGKIRYLVQDLHDDITKLLQAIDQLKSQSPELGKIPYTQLVNSLLENRYRNIKGNTKQFLLAKSFNLPFEVEEAVEAIKIITTMHYTPEDMRRIMGALLKALEVMGSQEVEKAKIQVGSSSASTIKCSGDVVVLKGCVNTTIYAGGNVKIKGHFKGGEIYCEGNAELEDLGSTLGAPPLVRIKPKGFVRITSTHPGSVIQIGSTRLNVTQELARSTFRLNSNDEIDIIPT